MCFKIGAQNSFANFTGKHLCWSLFLKNLQAEARLQGRCFSVKFAKFLGTHLLTEHLRWLLLHLRRQLLYSFFKKVIEQLFRNFVMTYK